MRRSLSWHVRGFGLVVLMAASIRVATAATRVPAAMPVAPMPRESAALDLKGQSDEQAAAKSQGCTQCHQGVRDMHGKATVHLGCTDCHGGNPLASCAAEAHVQPRFPEA